MTPTSQGFWGAMAARRNQRRIVRPIWAYISSPQSSRQSARGQASSDRREVNPPIRGVVPIALPRRRGGRRTGPRRKAVVWPRRVRAQRRLKRSRHRSWPKRAAETIVQLKHVYPAGRHDRVVENVDSVDEEAHGSRGHRRGAQGDRGLMPTKTSRVPTLNHSPPAVPSVAPTTRA